MHANAGRGNEGWTAEKIYALRRRWCAPSSLDGVKILLDVSRLDASIVQSRLTNFSLATLDRVRATGRQ